MSTENGGRSPLDPFLESASDEVLRLTAGTIFGQLLNHNSEIAREIAQMEHPSGPERRLERLYELVSSMGGFSYKRVTPDMQGLANLSAALESSPVFEDYRPQDYGIHPGFLATLLRTHAAGGDTDKLMSNYLRAGEGTAINPGRFAPPPERQTRLFESQARVDLPGLTAEFRMRTTGQDAPSHLLPKDVTGLLKLQAGMTTVNAQMQLDVSEAIAAVRADQAAKIGQARGIIVQAMRGIPQLIQDFKDVLGTRIEKVLITDRHMDTDGTERVLPDGTTLTSSRSRQRNEDRGVDIVAPAVHGELTLPNLDIQTGRSVVTRFSAAGFAMRDGEAADVIIHESPDSIQVTSMGDATYAAAQLTIVESEGMTIHYLGGSMKVGG